MKPVLQRAFTLIEVNLAMLVMAGGVLSMVSLYAFGFRESRQSREDVAGAVVAESVLNAMVTALSDRNLKWSEWKNFGRLLPGKGWKSYLEKEGSSTRGYKVKKDFDSDAKNVYDRLMRNYQDRSKLDEKTVKVPAFSDLVLSDASKGVSCALVATRESDESAVMTLAVRVVRKGQERTLFSQPVYFTEVHFQGEIDTY